jgi:hypothetical protein
LCSINLAGIIFEVFGVNAKFGATFGVFAVSTFLLTTLTALGQLVYQHLATTGGSLFVGWVSLFLAVVAVSVIGNTIWRLTRKPVEPVAGELA